MATLDTPFESPSNPIERALALALMITFPNMQPSWLTDGAVNQRNHLIEVNFQRIF